tara:strand:+ start:24164 stop:26566 length:2403 start_codon:yes stop_codon:yes gene_type:complete
MSSIQLSGSGLRTGASTVKVLEFGTEGTVKVAADLQTTGSAKFTKISGSSTLEMVGAAYFGSTVAATGSITAGSSFIIGSADLNETDLEKLDGITNGTVAANKALVVDGSKDLDGVNDLTLEGSLIIGNASMSETDLEKLDGITNGAGAANKALVLDGNADVASGLRNVTATGAITAGTSFIIGSADLNEADLEKLDGITNGAGAANKALVLDGNADVASGLRSVTGSGDAYFANGVFSGDLRLDDDLTVGDAINAGGRITGGTLTDGTATLTGGRFAALADLTASYAKIGVLDVVTINSKTTTVENVEVSASLMILSDGAATANEADGSGMYISGANAHFAWNNSMSALSSSHQMFVNGNVALGSGNSFVIGSADLNEADLEKLDGITDGTVAANKAVVVDSNKDASGYRNVTAAGAITAGTSFIIGSADLNEADLEKLDGITNGTVAASKAVVVDSDKDASGFRNVTATGAVTAGTSFIIGSADLNEADLEKLDGITNGTVAASKAVVVDGNKDFSGFRNMSGSGELQLVGAVTAQGNITTSGSFVIGNASMSEADLEKLDGITDGTAAANKAMVLDSNADITGGRNLTLSGELDAASGDFSGNIDVDGTANLDDVDIDGNTQADGTLTVGVNGTGYDVKFYGDQAGSYLMWDESSNSLNMINSHMSGASATFHGALYSESDAANNISILVPETHSIKAGQFVTFSDATLKKNVKQLDGAIEKVMSMRGVSYEMKKDDRGRAEVGFIAQEMKQVVPEVVYGDEDGNHGIDYGKLTSILVEAVKAQQTQIDELKALLKK